MLYTWNYIEFQLYLKIVFKERCMPLFMYDMIIYIEKQKNLYRKMTVLVISKFSKIQAASVYKDKLHITHQQLTEDI